MAEEFNINLKIKNLKNKFTTYHKFIINNKAIFLIIIALIFSVFLRMQSYDLPITDDWAENSLEQDLKNSLRNEIISQYPEITMEDLELAVSQQYSQLLKERPDEIKIKQEEISLQLKNYYQDKSGQTYLLAIDPYHFYRRAQNLIDYGQVGNEVRDYETYDSYIVAPNGKKVSNDLHSSVGAFSHKISSIFGNDSLLKTMFILPLILASLTLIPIFFIARKISGNLGGFIASFVLAIHPSFLARTTAGFSDTDSYTILLPLIILWCFSEAFVTMNKKKKIYLGIAAGAVTGIFSFAWAGWWYIFDIILASMAIYLMYLIIKYRSKLFKKLKTKNLAITAGSYIISSIIFVTLFTNFNKILTTIKAPFNFLFLKEAVKSDLWPNVYTTVAELSDVSFSQVISVLGGKFLFTGSMIGIILILLKKNKIQLDIKYGILLAVWFVTTLFTTSKGTRFVMLVIPIFAIGLGSFFSKLYNLTLNWTIKELEINKKIISVILIFLLFIPLVPLFNEAKSISKHGVPSINDGWIHTLNKIEEETPKNSIITSWWDFGHWFKAVADRPVTFDGGTQNRPQAHWVGKALLTSNEEESVGIIRMLDCGGNNAYDLILSETENPVLTKRIVDSILTKEENSAKEILKEYVANPEEILKNTHCDPPEGYLITSQDMVSKSGVWSHFGGWNFDKSFMYNTIKDHKKEDAINIIIEELGYTLEEANSVYDEINLMSDKQINSWIYHYPTYNQEKINCNTQENLIICDNGIIIDNENKIAILQTEEGQILIKNYRDDLQVYSSEEGTEEISIAYLPKTSQIMLMSPELIGSMFTELFYYEGKNLNKFESFNTNIGIDGFRIETWKIKW